MRKPHISSRCVANRYLNSREETIAEFHSGRHGGLISVRRHGDRDTIVEVYSLDKGVRVRLPPEHLDYTQDDWRKIQTLAAAKLAEKPGPDDP